MHKSFKWILLTLLVVGLCASFWFSSGWMQLCAGLAVFLFGMQCLEEGLRQLAGSSLEKILGRSTSSPGKALLFGIGGTFLLQSTTLVSLLAIAFISTGLIQLAGGIAVIFGANLGATSGIWLLALAGQNVSLGPLALPLVVFGVLAGFFGDKSKAAGRVLLGVAFIFLGIEQIKDGFNSFGDGLSLTDISADGILGALLFVGIGLLITVVLQSSHATLMLTLAALAGGQVELEQAMAIAIGSNVGSSVTTGFVGSLGGNRDGQRLALAHVLFNVLTAVLAFILLQPLMWLVELISEPVGANSLIQLALFHTIFNAMGVLLFWPWQVQLGQILSRWLPEREEPDVLIQEVPAVQAQEQPVTRARYLNDVALDSVESASGAVVRELGHLARLSQEVICYALYLPVEELDQLTPDSQPPALNLQSGMDADVLYRQHIKGVYSDLLSFMGRMDLPMDEVHQQFWTSCQLAALQLIDAVKDAKHLQKNLGRYLQGEAGAAKVAYEDLRVHLLHALFRGRELMHSDVSGQEWQEQVKALDLRAAQFDAQFRQRLFAEVRQGKLEGMQVSSLMNDLGYASRIFQSLRNVMLISDEQLMLREFEQADASDLDLGI